MRKFLLSAFLLLGLFSNLAAQSKSCDTCRKHKFSHWTGVQANALIRQIFNFNGSGNTVTNPYLFNYSLIQNKHQFGFDLGFGYTLQDAFTADGNTKSEKHNNDLYVRFGPMKTFRINNRFMGSVALHGVGMSLHNRTMSQNDFNSQIETFWTSTKQWGLGGGPCVTLRFRIANRVFIGTETSYYFSVGNTKSSITSEIIFPFGGQNQFSSSKTDNDFRELVPTLPAAIFLHIRF